MKKLYPSSKVTFEELRSWLESVAPEFEIEESYTDELYRDMVVKEARHYRVKLKDWPRYARTSQCRLITYIRSLKGITD